MAGKICSFCYMGFLQTAYKLLHLASPCHDYCSLCLPNIMWIHVLTRYCTCSFVFREYTITYIRILLPLPLWTQLGCFIGTLCVARLLFIIYAKEESRRLKRESIGDYLDGNVDIEDNYDMDKTPPPVDDDSSAITANVHVHALARHTADSTNRAWTLSNGGRGGGGSANGSSKTWALSEVTSNAPAVYPVYPAHASASKQVQVETLPGGGDMLGDGKMPTDGRGTRSGSGGGGVEREAEPSRKSRAKGRSKSPLLSRRPGMNNNNVDVNTGGIAPSASTDMWSEPKESASTRRPDSFSETQPVVSPINSVIAGLSGSEGLLLSRPTSRAAAGLELSSNRSTWRQATTSPLQTSRVFSSLPSVPSKAPHFNSQGSRLKRNESPFEDALLRAVEKRWTDSRDSRGSGDINELSRSMSIIGQQSGEMASGIGLARLFASSDMPSSTVRKTAMLAAGKCWTCQCNFENSAGQNSCLGCGRVSPVGRPRSQGSAIRQSSWVPPGGEVGGDTDVR